jgi:transcriptional regulator with GAF, ATPase, and Fis domain
LFMEAMLPIRRNSAPVEAIRSAALVGIAGTVKGAVLTLDSRELSIGRDKGNALVIDEPAVSRQHCLLRAEEGGYRIRDLASRNGTYVNGMPIKDRTLHNGDQIQIGFSAMLFVAQNETGSSVGRLADDLVQDRKTVVLRKEEAFYLATDTVHDAPPRPTRVCRDLTTLLRISARINSLRDRQELERELTECIFKVIPAQCGAIILIDEGSEDFASVFTHERDHKPNRPVPISRTIVRQVLQDKVSILSNDVQTSGMYSHADSLTSSEVSSLLAVPLELRGEVLGLIYLNTSNRLANFDEDHLQLLTGIAGIAAPALDTIRRVETLETEKRQLAAEANIEHNMVGTSAAMREVYQFIAKVAATAATVLIRGESGTGKELVAHAIHRNSPRADKRFVAINCAALASNLLESELFGHEKGAFTGAISMKKGKLEEADGGTVFLDEIGELAPELQAKLLRAIQEREFERVGGTRPIKTDFRLLAATNRDLPEAVKQGAFRQDLYYRLNVISITLPPLRERREDIPMLAQHFATKHCKLSSRSVMQISAGVRSALLAYPWPGNVRELENAIERAVVLGSTTYVLPEDLPDEVVDAGYAPVSAISGYHEAMREAKKQLIVKTLEQAGGNHNEAARMLGLHPNNLHRLIRNLNLKQTLNK